MMDRETYLEHRKSLVALGVDQIASYDKTLLLLSTGALGASSLFVEKFVGTGGIHEQPLLALTWLLFVITMTANLASYLSSWYDTDFERRQLDRNYENGTFEQGFNRARLLTQVLNAAALVAFIVGVIVLLLFCYGNLK